MSGDGHAHLRSGLTGEAVDATATLDLYVNQLRIWPADVDFEDAAMTAVIEVMGELNQLPSPLPAWSKYTDRGYLQRANAR